MRLNHSRQISPKKTTQDKSQQKNQNCLQRRVQTETEGQNEGLYRTKRETKLQQYWASTDFVS